MATHVDLDVQQLWRDYRATPNVELRNQLVELYLPLVKYNAELRKRLKKGGLLTRDARAKERKKYGMAGARKRFQFSKR